MEPDLDYRSPSCGLRFARVQAHGHAQIFGWIASFIFGIGFYSLPKLLRGRQFGLWQAYTCLGFWATGVLRWAGNVYAWHCRLMLPLSATLEILAFGIFFRAVTGHRSNNKPAGTTDSWISVVVAGTAGFMLTLTANLGACFYLALRGSSLAFPAWFDQRYLVLMTWGQALAVFAGWHGWPSSPSAQFSMPCWGAMPGTSNCLSKGLERKKLARRPASLDKLCSRPAA